MAVKRIQTSANLLESATLAFMIIHIFLPIVWRSITTLWTAQFNLVPPVVISDLLNIFNAGNCTFGALFQKDLMGPTGERYYLYLLKRVHWNIHLHKSGYSTCSPVDNDTHKWVPPKPPKLAAQLQVFVRSIPHMSTSYTSIILSFSLVKNSTPTLSVMHNFNFSATDTKTM